MSRELSHRIFSPKLHRACPEGQTGLLGVKPKWGHQRTPGADALVFHGQRGPAAASQCRLWTLLAQEAAVPSASGSRTPRRQTPGDTSQLCLGTPRGGAVAVLSQEGSSAPASTSSREQGAAAGAQLPALAGCLGLSRQRRGRRGRAWPQEEPISHLPAGHRVPQGSVTASPSATHRSSPGERRAPRTHPCGCSRSGQVAAFAFPSPPWAGLTTKHPAGLGSPTGKHQRGARGCAQTLHATGIWGHRRHGVPCGTHGTPPRGGIKGNPPGRRLALLLRRSYGQGLCVELPARPSCPGRHLEGRRSTSPPAQRCFPAVPREPAALWRMQYLCQSPGCCSPRRRCLSAGPSHRGCATAGCPWRRSCAAPARLGPGPGGERAFAAGP